MYDNPGIHIMFRTKSKFKTLDTRANILLR